MRHIMLRLLCLTLALLTALVPCMALGEVSAEDVVFRDRPSIAFRDPYSEAIYSKGAGRTAVYGLHTYSMPALVRESMALDYIGKAEAVLQALTSYGAQDRPLTIHLSGESYDCRVDGDTLYIGLQAFRSMDYITALTQLTFGVHVNYGLLYAVSCEVAGALGAAVEEVPPIEEALPAFARDGVLYADMNYACFIAPYTDESMQACVKALARDFAATLTAEEKTAFLTDYTNEQFYRRLNQYLLARHLPMRKNQSLWNVSIYGSGPEVYLCWESDLATYAVDRDFSDLYGTEWYGTEAPLVSSYDDLLGWIVYFDNTLCYLQGLFAPYVIAEKPLIIFDSDNTGLLSSYHAWYTYGYYTLKNHTIRAGACEVVDHEYVHALIGQTSVNEDMNEVLAYTYSTTEMPLDWSYDIYSISYDYLWRMEPDFELYDPDWASLERVAAEHLQHQVDYFNPDDMLVMIDVVTCLRGHAISANLTASNSHTIDMKGAKISFWHYLVRTYGEDAALNAALADDPAAHLGTDWDTLTAQWASWLEDTYQAP